MTDGVGSDLGGAKSQVTVTPNARACLSARPAKTLSVGGCFLILGYRSIPTAHTQGAGGRRAVREAHAAPFFEWLAADDEDEDDEKVDLD